MRPTTLLAVAIAVLIAAPSASGSANPFTGPTGTATMHGDSESSDTTPLPGPGAGALDVRFSEIVGACPTTLIGGDGIPVAVCTSIITRAPNVVLLDPHDAHAVDVLPVAGGSLFAGVYPYIDNRDRVVIVDGNGDLLRIAHDGGKLKVVDTLPLGDAARGGVVGLAPDWHGRVWFASAKGVAGYADPLSRAVKAITLGRGDELVANSISTAPGGTAVVTDRALYLLAARPGARPRVVWRAGYDRGPGRKPGQLSRGSGATPTFFGPRTGAEYLAITDNAAPQERLLVYDTRARSARTRPKKVKRVCAMPVVTGTENSPIGAGRSVWVASTYGYPYPAEPEDQPPADPKSAPFEGGLTRVDVGSKRCSVRWEIALRSAAVPRLSLADGLIYTTERASPQGATATGPLDSYALATVDANTGRIRSRQTLGATAAMDTLQLAPTIGPGGVLYQGTISGLFRVAPKS
jgi:hypothetical protein